MKITKEQLKQIVKEELKEAIRARHRGAGPEAGIDWVDSETGKVAGYSGPGDDKMYLGLPGRGDDQEPAAGKGAAAEDNVQKQHAAAVKIINTALDRITSPQSWAAIAPVVVKKISELAPKGQDVSWLIKAFGESAGRMLAKEISPKG